MKRALIPLIIFIYCFCAFAIAEDSDAWRTTPVITQAYELSSGKLYLEWEGQAPVYQVYMDGKSVANVIVSNAVIDVKKGTHTILVYPVNEAKAADTKLNFNLGGANKFIGGATLDVDLAVLGLDPKNLTAGTSSAPLNIDYTPNPIFGAAPDDLVATTDFDNIVQLSFVDRYYSDEYVVTIKVGKDTNYVKFSTASESSAALIRKSKSVVTLILDPAYLLSQECSIPELDAKYTFSVQLRKFAKNMLTDESVLTAVHSSKDSKSYQYTPTAAWKTAPIISYASQTADGQVTLQWRHDDNGLGCEYAILKLKKTMGIKTGEEEVAITSGNNYMIDDLMNGKYSFAIVPHLNEESGDASEAADVEVKNDWVVAPLLACEQIGADSAKLSWNAEAGVESYHLTVHAGDNNSLLRFVNLDFSKFSEHDIPSTGGAMEFTFTYPDGIDPVNGQKLKFEIYGIRHAANGDEQKTATSTQTITLKVTASDTDVTE